MPNETHQQCGEHHGNESVQRGACDTALPSPSECNVYLYKPWDFVFAVFGGKNRSTINSHTVHA